MKAYIYVVKMRIQTMMAYRLDAWSMMIMQCLLMAAVGFFWQAVYGGTQAAHGVTGDMMITYTEISMLIGSLYYMGVEDRISDAVKTGSIATDMIKPINLFKLYFAEDMGNIIFNLFFCTIPMFIVAVLIFGLPVPASAEHFWLFLASFVLGYAINWFFSAAFAMIAFTAIDLGPVFSIKYHFVNMLSGAIIPLWFFPEWLRSALYFLPFVYMYQEPLSMYIGKYTPEECLVKLGIQAAWLAGLAIIFVFAQSRATRRVMVQGG
ncbi:MAG: ABC transporter permease [Oscillospiraceae bacterium]